MYHRFGIFCQSFKKPSATQDVLKINLFEIPPCTEKTFLGRAKLNEQVRKYFWALSPKQSKNTKFFVIYGPYFLYFGQLWTMERKDKFWTKKIKSHKSIKVIWEKWQSVERPLHWRRGESLQKLKVIGGQMRENGFAQASLGHNIEWIVVLSLETFPQLECSNMSVGSPPLTPPCRCLLGLANRHHAIIHKSAHLYLIIQLAKIYASLHLHVQPPPSWYPLGFAWWSASNECRLICTYYRLANP